MALRHMVRIGFVVVAAVAVGLVSGSLLGARSADYLVEAGDTLVKLSCVDGPEDEVTSRGAGFASPSSGSDIPQDAPNWLGVGPETVSGLEQVSAFTFVERGPEGDVDAAYVVDEIDGRFYVVEIVYCRDRISTD